MEGERSIPAVEYAERSDAGRDPSKQVNEDACGRRETRFGHLCLVCDGMGGHAAGREAAEAARATIFEAFERADEKTPPGLVLRDAIQEASRRVHDLRPGDLAAGRPGSTVAAVLLHEGGTEVAHVGDSRAYLVHEGQIVRLTRDHSVVQELVDRGLLTPQQAVHHPEANRITRALGIALDVQAELRPQPVRQVAGDTFVLCSDGLTDLVEDHEILDIVGGQPAVQAVGRLVDLANARGGHDNVTVVILRAREGIRGSVAVPPTVAQTALTATSTRANASPAGQTLIERPVDSVWKGARPLEPTPAPASVRSSPPGRRAGPAVAIALALAAAVAALLVAVLLSDLAERRGKRNGTTWPNAVNLAASDASDDL